MEGPHLQAKMLVCYLRGRPRAGEVREKATNLKAVTVQNKKDKGRKLIIEFME